MARIFISYKRADKDIVFPLKDRIEKALGEPCWIDLSGIESDAHFTDVLINKIDEADVLLFMHSKSHQDIKEPTKDWTIRELNYANEEGKRFVIVKLDDTPLIKWLKFMFPDKQEVDATSSESFDKMLNDLRSWLSITYKEVNIYKNARNENRLLHIIFILQNAYAINNLMEVQEACTNALHKLDVKHNDVDFMVNILGYNHETQWMYQHPIQLEDFKWIPLTPSLGNNIEKMLLALNHYMSSEGAFMDSKRIFKKSFVLLLSNGESTCDEQEALQTIMQNPFFKQAERYAINLGNNPHPEFLAAFTGKKRRVFTWNEYCEDDLSSIIQRLLQIGLYAGSACELDDDDTWGD